MSDPTSDSPNLAQTITYEALSGFFVQNDRSPSPNPHPPAFGLKNHTSATYWKDFKARIEKLQSSAPQSPPTRYVVCWVARHGQGFHNVCVDEHGIDAWEKKFSKEFTDGKITWGPDAKLTPLGETQAKDINKLWKAELGRPNDPAPLPTKWFSSPLTRALETLNLTFGDIFPKDADTGELVSKPLVIENLREELAPYTSDLRSTKTQIQNAYPNFKIEEGFTEEDELWSTSVSEPDPQFKIRMKATLDNIFGKLLESSDTYISITAHSGIASMILRIIGHRSYPLPAGGVVPVVIKVTTT
ncbi:hypothetical protein BDV93DRAFT_521617 [Ceratobasidium sp. AG-I]|nr:hypothetical protein BDV93DRAFT_521617 [Ceratobasidium sp. AG-I]